MSIMRVQVVLLWAACRFAGGSRIYHNSRGCAVFGPAGTASIMSIMRVGWCCSGQRVDLQVEAGFITIHEGVLCLGPPGPRAS